MYSAVRRIRTALVSAQTTMGSAAQVSCPRQIRARTPHRYGRRRCARCAEFEQTISAEGAQFQRRLADELPEESRRVGVARTYGVDYGDVFGGYTDALALGCKNGPETA